MPVSPPPAAPYAPPPTQSPTPPAWPGAEAAFALAERAVVEADAALAGGDADAGLHALALAARGLGFTRALIEARDRRGERVGAWAAGPAGGALDGGPPAAVPTGVWRRWQALLDRRGTQWFDLAADAWARVEFETLLGDPPPAGVLLVPIAPSRDGVRVLLAAETPAGAGPPTPDARRAAWLLVRTAADHLARVRATELAEARAERLRVLHAAGVALARSLDEGEVVRELGRQVARLVPHDGLVVAHPDLERGTVRTALRLVRGQARARPELPLGAGPLAAAARSGLEVRLDEYAPAREPMAAADDLVGDGGPARSVVAVPMRVGTRLVGVLAVHAEAPAAFGDDHVESLRTVAAQAAAALANARLYASSEAERRQSDALVALARAVGGSLRPGEVLRLGLRHAMALTGAEGAFVALREDSHLHVVAGAGAAELFAGAHLAVEGTLPGRAVAAAARGDADAAVIENQVAGAGHAAFPLHDVSPVRQCVAVPLVAADGAIGVLAAVNRGADFEPADARVLARLAELLAVAAVNARLFERVAEATREWRVAFDATGAGMAVVDADGRVARANVRAAELLGGGAAPRQLLGVDFVRRLCGDEAGGGAHAGTHTGPRGGDEPFGGDAIAGPGALRAALAAGYRRRGRVRCGEGAAARVFEVLVSPHPAGGAVATFDDVTAQVALTERHRRVIETTRDALLIADMAGVVTYANPAALELFGRGAAIVGARCRDLVRADDAPLVDAAGERVRAGAPQRYDVRVTRPDGTERVTSVATAPMYAPSWEGDAARAVAGVVASLRDVTEERRARDAALASDARFARLVEAASDGILAVDADGRVTAANNALHAATGVPRGRLAGVHYAELLDPRDRGAAEALFDAALGGGRARGTLRWRDRRGRPRTASVSAAHVLGADGARGALAVVRDVTGERISAGQLVQREKLAAMGQLVSGVAHELNNPLAGVLAVSELLLAEPLLAEGPADAFTVDAAGRRDLRELTATVHREARRAARTVARLLTFARQQAPRRAPTDVNRALVDALDLRRSSLRLAGVELTLDLDYELPAAWADAHELQQVFFNLIANAEQALAEHAGERRLVLRTRAVDRNGRTWITAEVRDTGPGLSAAAHARAFEPFFTTKPEGEGTGLGLPVSAGIVREHGGELRVESEPGAGATFVVELPAWTPPDVLAPGPLPA